MRRALSLCSLALALSACSYDVSRLYPPPSEAGDVSQIDAIEDVVQPDVPRDGPPPPVCVSLLDAMQGRTIGGSLILSGTTTRGESTVNPIASCGADSNGAPEIFHEYQMQRGGTLSVSTDVPNMGAGCPLFADTIVSLQKGSCDMPGEVVACNDDDATEVRCTTTSSRVFATGLAVNERVMIIVDGYQANAGPYTITVTENALREVNPFAAVSPCGCPAAVATVNPSATRTEDVPVNASSDMGGGASRELGAVGATIGGPRTIANGRIVGIAGTLGLVTNEFATRPECQDGSMTLELVIGTSVVRAFVIDRDTSTVLTSRLMFRTAPNIAFAPNTPVLLRVRSLTGMGTMTNSCSVTFGMAGAAGNLTLLTTP